MARFEDILLKWENLNISMLEDFTRHLDSFRVLFAYHSGKIENENITYHDTREIFENGQVLGFSGNPRALFEQQNQKICYEYLIPKLIAKEPVSVGLIKEVHQILTVGTYDERRFLVNDERPGEFKKHDYVTGINEVGAAAENVAGDLEALVAEIRDVAQKDRLQVAAYFHAQFQWIHPFADGNGRVGRTLTNYLLMIHQHPPFIVYDEDKMEYYQALQCFDETEDIQPLYDFFMKETIKTWGKTT
ncbi:MAG: Fic family protein [Clostridia bacterium]